MESSVAVLTKNQRIFLGLVVLILVDIIWVSSSELTKYIYSHETFEKPFFCTYVKTSMFTFYLFGFLFWPPWRDTYCGRPDQYVYLEPDLDEQDAYIDQEPINTHLSTPVYVPVKEHTDKSSGTESDDSSLRLVRFNKVAEVRHLSEIEAADALLARLSYQASLRANELARRVSMKMAINEVSKIAFGFCVLWFVANYTYQVALLKTEAGVVNILSCTSSLFTLILAAIYPSSSVDKFSLSKLVAVILSLLGVVLVSFSDLKIENNVPLGAVLSLVSAFFYSMYLVFLKKAVKDESKIDIPMFFGFVGLFNLLLLWPILLLLHITKIETFEWPSHEQFMLIFVNGIMGTVISEALWLWGCFLTSSLMGTVAISLTIPMTMLADVILKHIKYPPLFFIGIIPMVISFLMVTAYSHFENSDPILTLFHSMYNKCFGKSLRFTEASCEQRESLIGSTNSEME